jgi:integrase
MARTKKRANGEGTVYQRADGLWVAQMVVRSTGKRRSFYGRTQKDVLQKLKAAQAEETSGTYIEPSKITVAEWLDTWLKTYKKHDLRQTTWDCYEMLVRRYIVPAIGSVRLQQLQPQMLQQLYNDVLAKGKSRRTAALIHTVIHAALDQAVQNQVVQRNAAEAAHPPRQEKQERRCLSSEETMRLIEAAKGERLYAAIVLALSTGLRRGELLALKWEDVDFENKLLYVRRNLVTIRNQEGRTKTRNVEQSPKTKTSNRILPLSDELIDLLKEHQRKQEEDKTTFGEGYQDNGFVFCTTKGTPISPRNFSRFVARIAEKAGLKGVSPHTLRHTFATRLAELGVYPTVVQKLLGHATVDVSMEVYSHVFPDVERDAIENLSLHYGCITGHKESPPE